MFKDAVRIGDMIYQIIGVFLEELKSKSDLLDYFQSSEVLEIRIREEDALKNIEVKPIIASSL